ncbi:DNA adenine methyltransferase YhdJ [Planctopirus ephydatiae]|uniref:Methyltransferase n=1 Tax=Planctopirus ephydatiae TaxID=2528019 RepID=A0A518GP11_9PLAN|nr:DNA methyltransferase [Planctopirus ephydatiae]QDV30337.1 DNA adenine methyltransferase YhdJ [Planctopirus ephydatiae]
MTKWRFHPACLLFPPLGEQELQALAENIRERGLLHPITTHNKLILDGRNRLKACEIAGVEPRFEEWAGTGSPLEWAISANLHRRHLTGSQKAVLALEMLPMLEAEAKERQRLSTGRGKRSPIRLATSTAKRGKASQIAAKLTGTNSAYVEQVKSISRKAPELVEQVKVGSLTVTEAARLSKLDSFQRESFFAAKQKQPDEKFNRLIRQVLPKKEPAADADEGFFTNSTEVWCGDSLKLMRSQIVDGWANVICTSPPFNRGVNYGTYDDNRDQSEYEAWLDEVFKEFHRVLTSNGSLFLIVGHSPRHPWTALDMAKFAGKYFTLQNQIVWVKSISMNDDSQGHFTPIPGDRYLNRNWDFVFHFSKNGTAKLDRKAIGVPYVDQNNAVRSGDGDDVRCAGDVWFIPFETVHRGDERANHPATFPPELAERCLKLAGCVEGGVVLDPFCGVNGLKAANKLGINAIGIDIDQQYCEAAASAAGTTVKLFPNR